MEFLLCKLKYEFQTCHVIVLFHFIKNEKKHVDEFEDVTLLFTDMVGFTAFSKNVQDPKEVV